MNFHIRDEVLSAYLDGEIESARERSVEDHVATCEECRARLAALRGVVMELRRAPRLQPPPILAHQVRRQVMEQAPPSALDSLRALFASLPLHPAMRTVMAMGLALALSLSLVGIERQHRLGFGFYNQPVVKGAQEPVPNVEVREGEPSYADVLKPTRSSVAGREFVFDDDARVWVQEGLEGSEPEARVNARSAKGQAMLTEMTDIDLLLEGGYRVLLRFENGTVELSPSPSPIRGASLGWPSARA
jgi:hypothetical protein